MFSVGMWENTDQNNSEYRHFLRSVYDGVNDDLSDELPSGTVNQ